MGYVLASQTHVIDRDTFKIIPISEDSQERIDCLLLMWSLGAELRSAGHKLFWHDWIKLNGFEVHLSQFSRTDGVPVFDWHTCDILFPDRFPLKLDVSPKYDSLGFLTDSRAIREVSYMLTHKGESSVYNTVLGPGTHYEWVDNLALMRDSARVVPEYLSVGLSPVQYSVIYRKRCLQGQTYALLLGSYAILLTDDLRYDSLVTLSGVAETLQHEQVLFVDNILHTDNPYVVKAKMMLK